MLNCTHISKSIIFCKLLNLRFWLRKENVIYGLDLKWVKISPIFNLSLHFCKDCADRRVHNNNAANMTFL